MPNNGPMFDVETDLRRLASGVRDSVAAAIALGWAARWGTDQKHLLILRSPGGEKTINLPVTNVNHNRAQSTLRQILTYTDRESVTSLIKGDVDVTHMDPTMVKARVILGNTLKNHFEEWLEAREAEAPEENETIHMVPVPKPSKPKPGGPERVPHPTEGMSIEEMLKTGTAKIVSRKPYLANATGQPYESPYVDEVLFDNQMSAYGCRECGFVSNRPRSVSNHAKRHAGPNPNANTRIATEPKFLRDETRPQSEAGEHGEVVFERRGLTLYAHLIAGGVDESVAVRASDALLDLPHGERVALAVAIIEGRDLPTAREQIEELQQNLTAATDEIARLREERRVLRDLLSEES